MIADGAIDGTIGRSLTPPPNERLMRAEMYDYYNICVYVYVCMCIYVYGFVYVYVYLCVIDYLP